MASLIDSVVSELEDIVDSGNPDIDEIPQTPTDLCAYFDIDINAVSSIEGSWERVDVGDNRHPQINGLCGDVFNTEGPAVYKYDDYMIVRGREDVHHVFFAFEPTV
jgi:hypothetical protein